MITKPWTVAFLCPRRRHGSRPRFSPSWQGAFPFPFPFPLPLHTRFYTTFHTTFPFLVHTTQTLPHNLTLTRIYLLTPLSHLYTHIIPPFPPLLSHIYPFSVSPLSLPPSHRDVTSKILVLTNHNSLVPALVDALDTTSYTVRRLTKTQ